MDTQPTGVTVPQATRLSVPADSAPGGAGSGEAARTQLGSVETASGGGERTRLGSVETASGGGERTRLGTARPAPAARPENGELRFGPGVPSSPRWSASATTAPARRRRPAGRMAPLLTALAIAGLLGYLLLWRPNPLVVAGAEVSPATPPGNACDVTVDLVGTIHTNGLGGSVEYRWLRSDGETTAPMSQTVDAGQTVVQVHLLWTLAGRGRYPATATLQILHPQPVTATGGFTYSCR